MYRGLRFTSNKFRFYSAQNQREASEFARELKNEETLQQTLKAPASLHVTPTKLDALKSKSRSLALSSWTSTLGFLRGPVKENLRVTLEIIRIVSREQRLIPSFSSWPEARETYRNTLQDLFYLTRQQGPVNLVKSWLKQATWGQVFRGLRIGVEMAAFYYIGLLSGQLIGVFV